MSDTPLREALQSGIRSIAKDWKKAKQRSERVRSSDMDRIRHRPRHISLKQAAYSVMQAAYLKASANGTLPANARQVMYAARPLVLKLTSGQCWKNSSYFTQILLPDYMFSHRVAWDVVWDARGQIREPHTQKRVGLGGVEVRNYVADWTDSMDGDIHLGHRYPTCGPANRYQYALFLEKEGFNELLRVARIAERYDLAIMSTKGMSVVAARQLVEELSKEGVTILVARDFDKAGFSIVHSLREDTRRYTFWSTPNVVDLGLRLSDVKDMGLESEPVRYRGRDPEFNLIDCGATEEEIAFLVQKPSFYYQRAEGQRVELNAMSSDQLIAWLEGKLDEQGVAKVMPSEEFLKDAYRHALTIRAAQELINARNEDVPTPDDLAERVREMIEGDEMAWDEAVWEITGQPERNAHD